MIFLLISYIQRLGNDIGGWGVFRYISVRAAFALIISFLNGIILGPPMIRQLRKLKIGQQILLVTSSDGVKLPDKHLDKKGIPTMGGVIIAAAFLFPVLLLCNLTDPLILMLISVSIGFGLLGYRDDYLKIKEKNSAGLSPRMKFIFQILLGLIVGVFMKVKGEAIVYSYTSQAGGTHITVPFIKGWYPDLGWFYILYAIFVITATSNAVNLTDGLDGLAIGTVIIVAASYGIVGYLAGRADYSRYLIIPYVPGGGEVAIFLAALVGASVSFLWFNANPAQVFMGDTGSLLLGGLIGAIALFLKQELLLVIIGGIFVLEALSVIMQVASYKFRNKKRIFLMSPIHHHYEKKGLAEPKIIARFWIVAALLALAGLTSLKLR
ncbi:phospho-N-acetylmuramoyl-pentapeptide-transferase [Candidatus Sumerlaeota bacterium]|nr:phospho-N-acetylmuramoyl-pentapeptide-transferase [Candidatus Sumerlaeota bacterium]